MGYKKLQRGVFCRGFLYAFHGCLQKNWTKNLRTENKQPSNGKIPAPAWDATALNFFSPFKVKDEVKKRITGKDYGLIFNCLATRAVYVDVSPDYSSKKFLMALRRFISIRGYPLKLYLDNRAQLVAANKELKKVVKDLDSRSLQQFGVMQGLKWIFSSANAP